MVKIFTFKKRKDFLRVAADFHVATRNVVLQAAPSLSDTDDLWVGYTATKRIGNAVCRNKCKRRLRAVVHEVLCIYALSHIDYVFIARNTTHTCSFEDLKKDIIYAIKKINKNFLVPDISTSDENLCNDL